MRPVLAINKIQWRPDFGAGVLNNILQPETPCLATLISHHKACLVRLRERAVCAFEIESKARLKIVAYEPRDRAEALERLIYLFAFTAIARDRLEDDEMEEFLTTIRNY